MNGFLSSCLNSIRTRVEDKWFLGLEKFPNSQENVKLPFLSCGWDLSSGENCFLRGNKRQGALHIKIMVSRGSLGFGLGTSEKYMCTLGRRDKYMWSE